MARRSTTQRDAARETALDEYLTSDDLADLLQVSRTLPRDWRYRGEGPPYIRIGREVRYPKRKFERWADEQLQRQETPAS